MQNLEELEKLSNKIKELLKNSPAEDLDKNINALIQGAFTKMGLISREEYEVQTAVLQRTHQKLTELEAQLAELEEKIK